jgi:hypothetical protein
MRKTINPDSCDRFALAVVGGLPALFLLGNNYFPFGVKRAIIGLLTGTAGEVRFCCRSDGNPTLALTSLNHGSVEFRS